MENSRLLVGALIKDKRGLEGTIYKVTARDVDVAIAKPVKFCEEEMSWNFTDGEEVEIPIGEKGNNASIAFRCMRDADPVMPHGYAVKDGILYKDYLKATEQGELVFNKIITCFAGAVVLSAKPKSKAEGLVDIFVYQPERDRFKKVIERSVPEPFTLMVTKTECILGVYREEEVKDEKNDVIGHRIQHSMLIPIDSNGIGRKVPVSYPLLKENAIITDRNIYLYHETIADEDGMLSDCDPVYSSYNIVSLHCDEDSEYDFPVPQKYTKVLECKNVIRFESDEEITLVSIYGHTICTLPKNKAKELFDYPILVDERQENNATIYSFTNDSNVIKVTELKVEKTKDRGVITSIL